MCACNVFYILACGLDRTYHAHQFIFSFFRFIRQLFTAR